MSKAIEDLITLLPELRNEPQIIQSLIMFEREFNKLAIKVNSICQTGDIFLNIEVAPKEEKDGISTKK